MIIIKGWATVPKKIDVKKTLILTNVKNTYEEAEKEQKNNYAFISPEDLEIREVEIMIK